MINRSRIGAYTPRQVRQEAARLFWAWRRHQVIEELRDPESQEANRDRYGGRLYMRHYWLREIAGIQAQVPKDMSIDELRLATSHRKCMQTALQYFKSELERLDRDGHWFAKDFDSWYKNRRQEQGGSSSALGTSHRINGNTFEIEQLGCLPVRFHINLEKVMKDAWDSYHAHSHQPSLFT